MKKLMYGVLGFIGSLVILALVVPLFINFNTYKTIIEEQVLKNLGRTIKIDGDIKIALLPSPSASINDVKLANSPQSAKPTMVTLDKAKVTLAWLPLFSKQLRVKRVFLSKPQILLESYNNGHSNWDFDLKALNDKPGKDVKSDDGPTPSSFNLSFDTIEIVNGTIHYKSPSGQHQVHDITAALTAQSMQGPFRLDGFMKVDNHDIKIVGKVKELADIVPVKLTLTAQGIDTNIEGTYDQRQQTFDGDFHLATDIKSLGHMDQKVRDKLNQPNISNGTVDITSHITASKMMTNLQHIKVKLDKDTIEGNANIRYSPLDASISLQGGPGNLLINAHMVAQKNTYKGIVKTKIDSLKQLIHWINPKIQELPLEFMDTVKFDGDIIIDDKNFIVQNIVLNAKNLGVTGLIKSSLTNNSYTYKLTGQGLLPILQWGGLPFKRDPGAVQFDGTTSLKDNTIVSNHTVHIANLTWNMQGEATMGQSVSGQFKINADTNNAASFLQLIMDDPGNINHTKLTTDVTVKLQLITVSNINLSAGIGTMTVTSKGNIVTKFESSRPFINAELEVGPFKIDDLFPEGNTEKRKPVIISQRSEQEQMPAQGKDSPINTLPAHEHWSRDPIDLAALKSFDGQFKITLKEFSRTDLKFNNTVAVGTLQNGVLDFPAIQSSFFDGQLTSMINLNAQKIPQLKFKLDLKDASLKRFIKNPGKVKIIGGRLNTSTDIQTSGKSLYDLVSQLEGKINFDVINGIVSGFDLKGISLKIKSLTSPTALLEMFSKLMDEGQTSFKQCAGDLEFHKGMGTFKRLILDADGAQASGTGKINLPAYQLDVGGQIQLTDLPSLPPFKVRLFGPLDNPAKSIDTNGLTEYMVKNIFKTLSGANLLKSAGDMISNIFKGDDTKSPADSKTRGQKNKVKQDPVQSQADDKKPTTAASQPGTYKGDKGLGDTLSGALKNLF